MKSKLFIGLSGLLVLLLSWGGASWFLSETSKQHFATTIESMALGKASSFVEVEVLNHAETFLGSSTEINRFQKQVSIQSTTIR